MMNPAMLKTAEWSKAVIERDGKCQRCARWVDLHAMHIQSMRQAPGLMFAVENGITLCSRCRKLEYDRIARSRNARMRSAVPHRKTLLRRIDQLERLVAKLKGKPV